MSKTPQVDMTLRYLSSAQLRRITLGKLRPGDVAALRHYCQLTQAQFAEAFGISVRTLENWEQDRTSPNGAALALLRVAARHPEALRSNVRGKVDLHDLRRAFAGAV